MIPFKWTPFICILLSCALTGCFDDLSSNRQPVTASSLTAADFSGIDSAQNLTTGILLKWTPVGTGKNLLGYRIYRYNINTPQMIASVDASTSSYVDANVVSGSKYSYLVKAVDPSNAEDPNTKKISTLAWSGLISVTSTTNSSITASFDPKLQGVTLSIYLEGGGRTKETIATLSTPTQFASGQYLIESWADGETLMPGANYNVYAEIYDNQTNIPDGNQLPYPVSTQSYGYSGVNGGNPGWNNVATLRAFGPSPNSEGSLVDISTGLGAKFVPTAAQVDIGFLPFTLPAGLSTSLYRYVVVRAGESATLDPSVSGLSSCPTAYSATTSLQACLVATDINPVTGLSDGLVVVHDTSVWVSNDAGQPPRYRYTMAIKHLLTANGTTGYMEALPQDKLNQFSVVVAVPPPNMVLVNREAANYEMCSVQKNASPDPLNKNRCPNYEVGSAPLNSGPQNPALNLDAGFYDMGYNFFVDRYPLACNNATTEVSNLATWQTATSVAASGNVLYQVKNGGLLSNCLVSTPSGGGYVWTQLNNLVSTMGITASSYFQTALTNDPGPAIDRPKFSYPNWDSSTAQAACSSFSENGYGTKRIPRMREYRALTAQPFSKQVGTSVIKDPYYQNAVDAYSYVSNTWRTGSCVLGDVTTLTGWLTPAAGPVSGNANRLSYSSNGGPPGFFIGAQGSSDCVSRYGVSDVVETPSMNTTYFNRNSFNTAWYPISDSFLWQPGVLPAGTMTGFSSTIDSGNVDVSYDVSGGQNGYVMNTTATVATLSTSTPFDLALGVPLLANTQNSSSYSTNPSASSNYGQTVSMRFPTDSTNVSYNAKASVRWSTSFMDMYNSRVRCVLPAD